MKKIFAILLSALALGGCENDGIPYVSLGLDDLYKVARMQTVDVRASAASDKRISFFMSGYIFLVVSGLFAGYGTREGILLQPQVFEPGQ